MGATVHSKQKLIVVGGGTAGWLTAALVAAEHGHEGDAGIDVVLVESPDIPTIGVGEGTWPSMRTTLQKIGLSEAEFMQAADASFKQGSKFIGWQDGNSEHYYYHPFSLPANYSSLNLALHWQRYRDRVDFATAVSAQVPACDRFLAPKQASTPEYAFNLNYGYHLDAGKFAELLRQHATEKLGVVHVKANVSGINETERGDIASLVLSTGDVLSADMFADCSGAKSLLLGQHFGVPLIPVSQYLFNDRAVAMQVPYASKESPIASTTWSTAQKNGWIWDIGLQSRRGVGYVYASEFENKDGALATLKCYIGDGAEEIEPKFLSFVPGYRQTFWKNNCVAIGMSAGFIEPLEASALVLVEQSARFLSEQFPRSAETMPVVAEKFNAKLACHWRSIVEFLKLHYIVSRRTDSKYWQQARASETIPQALQKRMQLWQQQTPWHDDFPRMDELFPAASWQYVLYGMQFRSEAPLPISRVQQQLHSDALQQFEKISKDSQRFVTSLPSNRELLNQICGKESTLKAACH